MDLQPTAISHAAAAFERVAEGVFAGRSVPLHELTIPAGGLRAARGTAMMVHGGAWAMTGPGAVASMRPHAERLAAQGWATLNVDYRPGRESLDDVLAFHDAITGWQGIDRPVGIMGLSAGGHLGLMTASERPSVSWVAGYAAPTDLISLGGASGAVDVRQFAQRAFGASDDALRAASPTEVASKIRARVLLATAAHDGHVPIQQMDAFARVRPQGTTTMVLAPGDTEFVHVGIAPGELERLAAAERQLFTGR